MTVETRLMARAISLMNDCLITTRVVRQAYRKSTAYYAETMPQCLCGICTVTQARFTRLQHALASLDLYSGQHDTVLLSACVTDCGTLPIGAIIRDVIELDNAFNVYYRLPKTRLFATARSTIKPHVAVDNVSIEYTRKVI